MSHCLVFKEGDSHLVKGVMCDFKRIHLSEFEAHIKDGWVSGLADLYQQDVLASKFEKDPESLTKDEHKEYAESLGLKLSKRMLEENMIAAIKEHLNDY